eukprot:Gregarina_sp_Poly_1__7074@NODE_3867_length_849_cov_58_186701_g1527_i2_p1_GENE_NODE_3867_length_849_cov_58_186701_g1527_i2NODE_3867_length_849_cov_58_186701_g1527_i2_p1_ORF_typecomplete_len163_score24_16CHORD/PF04968_12/5e03CHORD/PF04968_12/0_0026_NODE_3867_length_849_cov_58_186701_g1527_i236524
MSINHPSVNRLLLLHATSAMSISNPMLTSNDPFVYLPLFILGEQPAAAGQETQSTGDLTITRLPDMASGELRRKRRFSESTMQWKEGDPLFKKRVTLDLRSNPYNSANPGTAASNEISSREWIATGHFSDGAEVWSCCEHIILRFDPFVSSTLQRKTAMLNI